MASPGSNSHGVEASHQHPCPACERTSWCVLFETGVNCYRVESDLEREDGQGNLYWYHSTNGTVSRQPRPVMEPTGPARGTADQLDRVYAELQQQLTLSAHHEAALLARGLSKQAIRAGGFRSVPGAALRATIAHSLADRFSYWQSVPGLVVKDGKPRLALYGGILLFLRDLDGRISGVQVRADDEALAKLPPDQRKRYLWLSSGNSGGPKSKACPAWWPSADRSRKVVRVTEGAMKAYVSTEFTGVPGISAGAGVGTMACPLILDWLEHLTPGLVLLAPDQDAFTKPEVAQRVRAVLTRLVAQSARLNFQLRVEVWSMNLPAQERPKGIDDALAAGCDLQQVEAEEYLRLLPGKPLPTNGKGVHPTSTLETLGDPGPDQWAANPVEYPVSLPTNEPLPSGWTAPEPFHVRDDDLVVAPLWVLPESLRHMVDTVADAKQVTPGAVLGSLLGLLSAICGGRYTANLASQYETHAHIWILLALRSAGGKSEALKVLAKPVFRAQKRLQHETQEQNDRHTSERANLFKQIAAMESGSPEEYPGQLSEARGRLKDVATKPLPRFLWKDVSPQKLDILYARHQRVGIVSPESADWISLVMGYGKDQGPTLGSCLSGFSVEAHGSDRVTREESHCERPVLTLFLACQEKDVKDFIGDPVARRRGFLGRTLVFRGQSLVGKRLSYDRRPSITPEDVLPWNTLVEVVTSQIPGSDDDGWVPLSVPVTNEGRELFCRLFDVVEKRLSEYSPDLRLDELEDIAGRSLEQVGRLAILLHVLWTAPRRIQPTAEPISEATVFRAFTLMLWALQGFMDLSAPGAEGAHNAAMSLWKDLDASALCATGTCTVTNWVQSGPNRWRSASKLESQLSILEALGYVQIVRKRNVRGPASKMIELNPLARGVSVETAAMVATVFENPLFIEVITSQPHLLGFARVARVSDDQKEVKGPPEGIPQNGTCDGISTAGKASCQTVATVAGIKPEDLAGAVRAAGDLF